VVGLGTGDLLGRAEGWCVGREVGRFVGLAVGLLVITALQACTARIGTKPDVVSDEVGMDTVVGTLEVHECPVEHPVPMLFWVRSDTEVALATCVCVSCPGNDALAEVA
jgi:hypothetical protein